MTELLTGQPLPSLLFLAWPDPCPPPDGSPSWYTLGLRAAEQDDWKTALECFTNQLLLRPDHLTSVNNLAVSYAREGKLPEAYLTARRASAMLDYAADQTEAAAVLANLGVLACDRGLLEEAEEAIPEAVHRCNHPHVKFSAALVYAALGKVNLSVRCYQEVLRELPDHPLANRNYRFMQTLTDCTPKQLAEYGERYYRLYKRQGLPAPYHRPDPNKPPRVGYVSGDFRACSPAFSWAGVVLGHSHAVEVYFYSNSPTNPDDPGTKKFAAATAGRWREIHGLTDAEADALVRSDRIDILVDLDGHSGSLTIRSSGGRLGLFARKPAPIQVTAWGFAHGTSCPTIDYFFADPVAVPKHERSYYTEQVVDLPCVITYDPMFEYGIEGVSPPPATGFLGVTFGCYARQEKLTPQYLRCVRDILRAVPDSRIVFKDHSFAFPYHQRRVLRRLDGVERKRVLFLTGSHHLAHLWSVQFCDLMLDPFPHSGGVTSLEQLWMGVPMVTRYGKQAAGRTTASALIVLDRQDWIAYDEETYTALAVRLAGSAKGRAQLAEARHTLRQELEQSPIIRGYVTAVEDRYRWMMGQYAQKEHAAA